MTRVLPHRLGARPGSLLLALALLVGPLACDGGDDEGGDDETTTSGDGDGDPSGDGDGDPSGDGDGDPGTLSYAADIQPIWDANCVTACHSPGGSAVSFLDLSGDSYANVVGAMSASVPSLTLVIAGDAENSYLVHKLNGTQAAAGGGGSAMPSPPNDPLDAATIATIETWINDGAAP